MMIINHHAATARLSAAALLVASMVFSNGICAQGKSGNTVGAPSGSVGGGATGAANRGGAGGISNPNPGGSPATAGDPGQSSGPRATETSRPGYLGGRTTEVTPPITPPSGATIVSITMSQYGKCPVPGGVSSHETRISGSNLGRIDTVSRYLTRSPQKGSMSNTTYLLADLQEELQKQKPDLALAGTYLGIVAKTAVTPQLAMDVSESLCSPISRETAEQVANIAETQRRKLSQER